MDLHGHKVSTLGVKVYNTDISTVADIPFVLHLSSLITLPFPPILAQLGSWEASLDHFQNQYVNSEAKN